ncbi:MAG: hypothetical protein KGH64_00335, partial [Candidatus Micrarchaeota archaeon]|nr:hypothetical protein [Candidatus Micrarchaeota archaeon]
KKKKTSTIRVIAGAVIGTVVGIFLLTVLPYLGGWGQIFEVFVVFLLGFGAADIIGGWYGGIWSVAITAFYIYCFVTVSGF